MVDPFTPRPSGGGRMDDLSGSGDSDVDAFVDANLRSFAAWDIAVYLDHHVGAKADVAELAGRLGRKEHEIESVLRHFVDDGVAVASAEADGVTRFRLSDDTEVRRVVSRFVDLAKVREIRLEFVRRVLALMSRA
jgi:hypothetical protein